MLYSLKKDLHIKKYKLCIPKVSAICLYWMSYKVSLSYDNFFPVNVLNFVSNVKDYKYQQSINLLVEIVIKSLHLPSNNSKHDAYQI